MAILVVVEVVVKVVVVACSRILLANDAPTPLPPTAALFLLYFPPISMPVCVWLSSGGRQVESGGFLAV